MRWAEDGRAGTVVILAVAGTLLYIASRTAAAALAGHGAARPGWRAVGHWLAIAVTALVAAARGQPEIAVALAFATSVSSLSFVLGVLTYLAPMDQLPPSRRGWPFVLPAALLPLIAGFSGHFTWVHALAMTLLGGALVSTWRDPTLREAPAAASPFADAEAQRTPRRVWVGAAEIVLAVALAVVGGWYAVNGTVRAAAASRLFPAATITVVILSPLLTLPMLNPGPPESARAQTASTTSTLVAVALLNLCALLPMLTFVWYLKTGIPTFAGPAASATTVPVAAADQVGQPLPFPLATWRVDAVVLTVLGFIMIPVSLGRWELGRWEAIGLVLGYAIYLVLVALASIRL